MSKSKKNASKSESKASKAQRKAAVAEVQAKDATANANAVDADRVPLSEVMKKPVAKGTKAPQEPKPAKEKKISGLDAAFQVLSHTGEPMRCKDMVDKMLSTRLWNTGGKTPSATIYSAILREITTKGAESRFKKTDRGLFTINSK